MFNLRHRGSEFVESSRDREGRVDGFAVRHLALSLAAAGHPVRRMNEVELAAHMLTVRSTEVRHDLAAVMRYELRSTSPVVPIAPAAKSRPPPGPKRFKAVDCGIGRDLKEWPGVRFPAGQYGVYGAGDRILAFPTEVDRCRSRGGRADSR